MDNYGLISLLPVVVVIVTAIISKRAFEPLALGSIVGFIILHKHEFLLPWVDAFTGVVAENAWFCVLFVLFGSVIELLNKSGSAIGFSRVGVKFAKNRTISLFVTWVLGLLIFIDDYLNNLAIGTAMKNVTDKFKVSREFLAFVINSTGASICVLVPVSTWAIFMSGLYAEQGVLINGSGMGSFIAAIPYMWYPFIAILIVPLFILGVIPTFGPMRKAEKRARETGIVLPDSYYTSNHLEIPKSEMVNQEIQKAKEAEKGEEEQKASSAWNFLIPLIVITVLTIILSDMLIGIVVGLFVQIIMYLPQKLMTLGQALDYGMQGAKSMLPIVALVMAYFCLQEANDQLGLTPYVIENVSPYMNAQFLPLITFIVVAVLAFTTGSFWGMPAVAFPIIIPLAEMYGCPVLMAGAAIVSGAAFGSHACFYGDAATLVSTSTDIKNYDYAKNVSVMTLVPFGLTVIAYLVYALFFA